MGACNNASPTIPCSSIRTYLCHRVIILFTTIQGEEIEREKWILQISEWIECTKLDITLTYHATRVACMLMAIGLKQQWDTCIRMHSSCRRRRCRCQVRGTKWIETKANGRQIPFLKLCELPILIRGERENKLFKSVTCPFCYIEFNEVDWVWLKFANDWGGWNIFISVLSPWHLYSFIRLRNLWHHHHHLLFCEILQKWKSFYFSYPPKNQFKF